MNIKYQRQVLKKALSLSLLAVNIFGLWPYIFIQKNRRLKYSYLKAVYSAFVLCLGLSTYMIIGPYMFTEIREKHFFDSFTLKLVTTVYAILILMSFLLVYVGILTNSKKVQITYIECKEIVDAMNETFRNENTVVWRYLLEILLKTVIFDFIEGFLSLQNYSISTAMPSKLYVVLLFPPIAVRLHMNTFYCALLVFSFYFRQINIMLNEIVSEAKIFRYRSTSKSQWIWMEKHCELSEQIDNLSILYFRLAKAVTSINSIFSVTITMWYIINVIGLTIQWLLQFVTIIELIQQGKYSVYLQNIFGFSLIVLTTFDIFITSYACERLLREVCNLILSLS